MGKVKQVDWLTQDKLGTQVGTHGIFEDISDAYHMACRIHPSVKVLMPTDTRTRLRIMLVLSGPILPRWVKQLCCVLHMWCAQVSGSLLTATLKYSLIYIIFITIVQKLVLVHLIFDRTVALRTRTQHDSIARCENRHEYGIPLWRMTTYTDYFPDLNSSWTGWMPAQIR